MITIPERCPQSTCCHRPHVVKEKEKEIVGCHAPVISFFLISDERGLGGAQSFTESPELRKGRPLHRAHTNHFAMNRWDLTFQPHSSPSKMCNSELGSRHLLETPSVIRILRAPVDLISSSAWHGLLSLPTHNKHRVGLWEVKVATALPRGAARPTSRCHSDI